MDISLKKRVGDLDGGQKRKDRRERKTKTDILAFQEMMCVHRDINITMKRVLLIHKLKVQNSR